MGRSYEDVFKTIQSASDPAFLWDVARRRIVFANDAALLALEEPSLDDLTLRRFEPHDTDSRALERAAARLKPGQTQNLVLALIGEAPRAARASEARLKDGRLGLLVIFVGDDAGSPAPPDGAQILADAPVAIAVFATDGRRLAANSEAEALLMPGDLPALLASPADATALIQHSEARGIATRSLMLVTRFGLRRGRITLRRVGAAGERDVPLIAVFEDLEDRSVQDAPVLAPHRAAPVEAEAIAPPPMPSPPPLPAASGAALDEVVAALMDPTLAADASGRVIAMNVKAARLLGESAKGEPLLNMLPPDLKADAAAYTEVTGARGIERSLEDGRETRIRRGDELVPVRAVFARLATGEILVQFRDLTSARASEDALRRAREDAEEASRHKSSFLASISHELRTPLNAIIGFAEIMHEERFGPVGNAKYMGYARDIHESGKLLLSLINDLLDLSKAESGKIELEPDAVELQPIITSVMSLLSQQADALRVSLHPVIAKNLPAVVADERSIKQILINLTGNAIKYCGEGGKVEIAASLDAQGAVHLTVRDNGPGMDADDLKRAMELYQRAKPGRKDREGTGLGLPLARALTEANKALFAIESAPGRGTLVRITFPSALVLAG